MSFSIKLKVDTADACVVGTEDLQNSPFPIDIEHCCNILNGYGGGKIENTNECFLNFTFMNKTMYTYQFQYSGSTR